MAGAAFRVEADFAPTEGILRQMAGGAGMALQSLVGDMADVLTETVRTSTPVSPELPDRPMGGALAESLGFTVGKLGASLEGLAYGRFVIAGTRPHEIRARNTPHLRFFWEREGRWFVGRKVNHPGSRPNDFRVKGLDLAQEMGFMREAYARFWRTLIGRGA